MTVLAIDLRTRQIRAIKAAQRAHDLDDATYRALLVRVTGKDSCAAMTDAERGRVLDELNRGNRRTRKSVARSETRPGTGPARRRQPGEAAIAAKAKALWQSLWNLGETGSAEDSALDAFVKRQAGVDSLRFITAAKAHQVVEALKGWCTRAGVRWPTPSRMAEINHLRGMASLPLADTGLASKFAVIDAQWRRLADLGAIGVGPTFASSALQTWLQRTAGGMTCVEYLDAARADDVMRRLGVWLRDAQNNPRDAA